MWTTSHELSHTQYHLPQGSPHLRTISLNCAPSIQEFIMEKPIGSLDHKETWLIIGPDQFPHTSKSVIIMYSNGNMTRHYFEIFFWALENGLLDVNRGTKKIKRSFLSRKMNLKDEELLSASTVVIPTMIKLWPCPSSLIQTFLTNQKVTST